VIDWSNARKRTTNSAHGQGRVANRGDPGPASAWSWLAKSAAELVCAYYKRDEFAGALFDEYGDKSPRPSWTSDTDRKRYAQCSNAARRTNCWRRVLASRCRCGIQASTYPRARRRGTSGIASSASRTLARRVRASCSHARGPRCFPSWTRSSERGWASAGRTRGSRCGKLSSTASFAARSMPCDCPPRRRHPRRCGCLTSPPGCDSPGRRTPGRSNGSSGWPSHRDRSAQQPRTRARRLTSKQHAESQHG
jgi:hypothetical protein